MVNLSCCLIWSYYGLFCFEHGTCCWVQRLMIRWIWAVMVLLSSQVSVCWFSSSLLCTACLLLQPDCYVLYFWEVYDSLPSFVG
jgi:hypothetical protein